MDANFSAVARCERKFRPPKLVRATAYGVLTCKPEALALGLMKYGRDPDSKRAAIRARIADVARLR